MTEILAETIGPMRSAIRVRQTGMSSERAPNHYLTARHDAMPHLIGIRFLGQNFEQALRRFQMTQDHNRAALAAAQDDGA